MSRRRYISTNISTDTAVNRLAAAAGDFAAMLYTWMIPHAADDGSLPADPEELMFMVIPGRRDKTPADVAAALDAMRDQGLIEWDGADLRFPAAAFYRYQTYIQEGKRRGANQRETPQDSDNSANQRKSAQNASSPSLSPSPSPSFSPSVREGAHANGVRPTNGAHPPARAAPPRSIVNQIEIPDPFPATWIPEFAREHGLNVKWTEQAAFRYVLNYSGTGTRRSIEEWTNKCQKWILEDHEKSSRPAMRR